VRLIKVINERIKIDTEKAIKIKNMNKLVSK
jgi:hypothetical protein